MARRYHHGDLRNALLDAAQAIVAKEGVAGVTMAKVAGRSKVSSGAPYRHFADRMALLRALSQRAHARAAARMATAAEGAPTPLEGFRRAGIEYVRFAVDEPTLFTVMSRGELTDRTSAEETPGNQAFAEALRALLSEGPPDAPVDPNSPVLAQLAARCMMHGLAHFFADGMLATLGVESQHAARLADALTYSMRPEALAP